LIIKGNSGNESNSGNFRLEASQEQSHKLTWQIIYTQEEKRHRVSRELHDEAGQAIIPLK